jgi:transposase-like protein
MLDELLEGKEPEEILGREGLLKELTKRLVERALEGEMTVAIPTKADTRSEGRRSLVPSEGGHRFRRIPDTVGA